MAMDNCCIFVLPTTFVNLIMQVFKPIFTFFSIKAIVLRCVVRAEVASDSVPLVQTSSGLLRGFSPTDNVNAYVGIRYAQPPTADLRFEPPQPYSTNDTKQVFNATEPFSSCYQVQYDTFISDKVAGYAESEDCLFLNVWDPVSSARNESLPVLISIYGGGFSQGGTTMNDGVDFVKYQKDIIYVSFKYARSSLRHCNPLYHQANHKSE